MAAIAVSLAESRAHATASSEREEFTRGCELALRLAPAIIPRIRGELLSILQEGFTS
jgi:hypothetical protein